MTLGITITIFILLVIVKEHPFIFIACLLCTLLDLGFLYGLILKLGWEFVREVFFDKG